MMIELLVECGTCKHWHQWKPEKQEYKLLLGDCDRIPMGTEYYAEEFNKTYKYDGYSFEDECYDDEFHCYEPKENKDDGKEK